MKAIVYDKRSAPHKLVFREIERPVPNENELLIKIYAVSLNAADYRSMKLGIIPKKKIFGADIAGIVESTGINITNFKQGDRIFGDIADYGFGGLAEYAVVPESLITSKPTKLTFLESAALPMAAQTALQAIRNKGEIKTKDEVLILGSGGGVGTSAIQIAKYFGAINGYYPLLDCIKILKSNGRYVMVGGSIAQIFKPLLFGRLLSIGSKKIRSLTAKTNVKDLDFIATLADENKLKPMIDKSFRFSSTPEAMQYLSGGHALGKIVIQIRDEN